MKVEKEFSEAAEYSDYVTRSEVESVESSQAVNQPVAEWRRSSRLASHSGEDSCPDGRQIPG